MGFIWSRQSGSNRRPADYKSVPALLNFCPLLSVSVACITAYLADYRPNSHAMVSLDDACCDMRISPKIRQR